MAVGENGLIEFTLIGGKVVNLIVNQIVSIEELTTKELQSKNFRKFGSALPQHKNINRISMTSGKSYIVISSDFATTVSETKSTISVSPAITGGRF